MTQPSDDALFDRTDADWQALSRDPQALMDWMDQVLTQFEHTMADPIRRARQVTLPPVATGPSRLPIVDLVPPPSHPPLRRVVAPPPRVADGAMPPGDAPTGDVPPTPMGDTASQTTAPSHWFQVPEPKRPTTHHEGLLTRPVPSAAPPVSQPSPSPTPPVGDLRRDPGPAKNAETPMSTPPHGAGVPPAPDEGPSSPAMRPPSDTGLPYPSEIRSRTVDDQRRKRLEASIQDALKKNKGTIQ